MKITNRSYLNAMKPHQATFRLLVASALLFAASFAAVAQSAGTACCPRRPGNGVRQAPAQPKPNRPLVGQPAILPVDRTRAAQAGAQVRTGCRPAVPGTGSCGTPATSPPCSSANRVLPANTISESNLASANAALRAQGYALRKGANGEVILVRSGAGGR